MLFGTNKLRNSEKIELRSNAEKKPRASAGKRPFGMPVSRLNRFSPKLAWLCEAMSKRAIELLGNCRSIIVAALGFLLVCAPGFSLLAAGICLIVAPHLAVTLVAFALVLFGSLWCAAAIKFVQLKNRFDQLARSFEAQVYLHRRAAAGASARGDRSQGRSGQESQLEVEDMKDDEQLFYENDSEFGSDEPLSPVDESKPESQSLKVKDPSGDEKSQQTRPNNDSRPKLSLRLKVDGKDVIVH